MSREKKYKLNVYGSLEASVVYEVLRMQLHSNIDSMGEEDDIPSELGTITMKLNNCMLQLDSVMNYEKSVLKIDDPEIVELLENSLYQIRECMNNLDKKISVLIQMDSEDK